MQHLVFPFVAFLVTASLLFTGLIVWMGLKRNRESQTAELELRRQILDRFSSADEFVRFMETDNGRRFLETTGEREKSIPRKILGSITSGLVLVMLGIGFAAISWVIDDRDALYPAFITGAIGIGLLLSAAISYRLSRAWQLLEPDRDDDSPHEAPSTL